MNNAISKYFESPEDKEPTFIRLVRNILIFTVIATILSAVALTTEPDQTGVAITIYVLVVSVILEVIALAFTFRGDIIFAKVVVPIMLIITITISAVRANTIHDISVTAYPLIVLLAALLQGRRFLLFNTFIAGCAITYLGLIDLNGTSNSPIAYSTTIGTIIIGVVLIFTGAAVINLLIGRLSLAIVRAEANERSQIAANKDLKQLQASLEQQVQERTTELTNRGSELENAFTQIQRRAAQFKALAQVAQSISYIRDPQELMPRITSVISEFYGFYHVGVFLIDEFNEYAVLTAANSEGGKRMLARNHRLRVGEEGIVGNVTATGNPRISLDVGADAIYFGNPDLPDTHSEMALPLRSGGKIIGALDVQSMESGAFSNEDVQTLSLLADQVSLAIENARLFEKSNRTLNELQVVMRQSTREAWKRLPEQQKLLGYRFTAMGSAPLKEPVNLAEKSKGTAKAKGTGAGSFIVPIELRGEIIGNLVVQSPTGGAWNEDQQDLIRAVAERVALSAENARLFEETTQRAERERLVSEISGKIRSHNDPQAMIETAINELRSALGASRVEVVPQKNEDVIGKDLKV